MPYSPFLFECVDPQGFLALAAAGQQDDGAGTGAAPLPALRPGRGIRHHVELEIAEHAAHRGAHLAQALGIGFGLRPDGGKAGVGRPGEPRQAPRAVTRLGIQPCVGQQKRHAVLAAAIRQVGPDLRFHQHADGRAEAAKKPLHRARRVPRLPDLDVTGLQQFFSFGPARGGAVRQQQAHARQQRAQFLEQDRGRPGFAQRHRVHPHEASGQAVVIVRAGRSEAVQRLGIAAEALAHGEGVAGLGARAPRQLAPQQGLRSPERARIHPESQLLHGQLLRQGCRRGADA